MAYRLRIRSRLATDRRTLWAHASSMDGVNAELAPVRMSRPAGAASAAGVPLGRPLFRSVISLWGLVPLDVHELRLVDVRPEEVFHESSDGVEITDELEFEPRIFGFLVARIVAGTFERRHACLRRLFPGRDAGLPRVEWLPSA